MQTYREYAPTGFDPCGLALDDRQDWLVLIGRNRDSDHLSESNFDAALAMLGGESETVEVHRFGHWACGWLEIIIVAPDSDAATEAERIEGALSDYPVLDESDYSEREFDSYNESWRSWGWRDFVRAVVRKLSLDDDTADALEDSDASALQEWFESLNECGDYHEDGSPCIDRSVRNATAEDVTAFLTQHAPAGTQPDLFT